MAIYAVDSGHVIASGGQWLPGVYDSAKTARWAFQFSDDALAELHARVNGIECRAIRRGDLRACHVVAGRSGNR